MSKKNNSYRNMPPMSKKLVKWLLAPAILISTIRTLFESFSSNDNSLMRLGLYLAGFFLSIVFVNLMVYLLTPADNDQDKTF